MAPTYCFRDNGTWVLYFKDWNDFGTTVPRDGQYLTQLSATRGGPQDRMTLSRM